MRSLREFIAEQVEPDFEKLVPYAGHIEPQLVQLFGGPIMLMMRLRGVPYELALGSERNGRTERINTMLRAIADPDLQLSFHLVHHEHTPPAPQPLCNGFAGDVLRDYQHKALGGIFTNDWFLSLLIHPPAIERWTSRAKSWLPWCDNTPVIDPVRIARLRDAVYIVQRTLSDYEPRILGHDDVEVAPGETVPITWVGTALRLIRTAQYKPIAHTNGALASAVYTERARFGSNAFRPDPQESRFGAMLSFLNYPAETRAGMLNALMGANYPCVFSHSFRYTSGRGAVSSLELTRKQMVASGDRARMLIEGLDDAMDRVASLTTAEGVHHFGLAVYATSLPELDRVAADAKHLLQHFGGASPVRDENVWHNGAMTTAYFMQLPGSPMFKPRPGKIDTANLADMASLDGYAEGAREGYWGPSPIRFKTNGGTAYDFVPHDEDVPHTLVIGRIGSGKTVCCGMIVLAMEPNMGPGGIRLVIDKDESHRLSIEAANGTYQKLLRNQPSGLAPLIAFPDSPRTRSFLHRLISARIISDKRRGLTSLEDQRLVRAIARQMKMPPGKRGFWGIREFLGYEDDENGAGARLEKWCEGGSMGWLLDNRVHRLIIGAGLHGVDFTDLLPRAGLADDGACEAAAAIITHQLSELMDGRRIMAVFEECRFYIEVLAGWIEDLTLTGRKKEVAPWLIFQEADHAMESSVGSSLVSQMRTKIIFPDASHNPKALERLGISPAAIRMLKTDMTIGGARRFLLWRNGAPAICEFDLTGMRALNLLSGRAGTINLWERVQAEGLGADEFMDRLENSKQRIAA